MLFISSFWYFFQVEPYFTSLALFDVRAGRKLSENFHFDINDDKIRSIFFNTHDSDESCSNGEASTVTEPISPELEQVSPDWIQFPKQVHLQLSDFRVSFVFLYIYYIL